jgi:hypothetical protein
VMTQLGTGRRGLASSLCACAPARSTTSTM